jgi:hypothetical protein
MPQRREILVAGAALTVLAAVAFDLFAGEAPLHAAVLGAVTALAAWVRVRLATRRRSLLQFVCGSIVSLPAIHYAAKLAPHSNLEHGHGAVPGSADLFVACLQIMVVLAVVGVLTFAEQVLFALAVAAYRLYIMRTRCLRPSLEQAGVVIAAAPSRQLKAGLYSPSSIARRGPPTLVTTF